MRIQIAKQGQAYGEAKQADNAQHLCADKHAAKGHHRVQAQLAAHYAETTGGQNIPVDVTAVKQVKKIPSGKPGMVIYHTYRTVIVNPYKDIVVDELNAEHKEEK